MRLARVARKARHPHQVTGSDSPAPDEVRLQITWCGICGTDLEHAHVRCSSRPPTGRTRSRAAMRRWSSGTFVGTVVKLGSAINDLKIGDRWRWTRSSTAASASSPAAPGTPVRAAGYHGLMTMGGLAEIINAPA